MAIAILHPGDCLTSGSSASSQTIISRPLKFDRNPNPNLMRSGRRKPSKERLSAQFSVKNLVMGQVKILKRGEELKTSKDFRSEDDVDDEKMEIINDEESVLCSTDRLGPEPEMVPKQIRLGDLKSVNGIYSGSAIFNSPPPSSLPFPAFFTKKDALMKNDAATMDLRRLLRLNLA